MRFMVLVLDAFHGLVRNYGLAIMMLVVVLRLVLYPVTRWSQPSPWMMAMFISCAPASKTRWLLPGKSA